MTRFSFSHCDHCGKLNITGARCVCDTERPTRCDCTYDGNIQQIGPNCRRRQREAWAKVTER